MNKMIYVLLFLVVVLVVVISWMLHRSTVQQGEQLAIENCSDCHDAQGSSASTDVLMPGIASCRECHGNERSDNLLASGCISCHRYHVPGNPAMATQIRPQTEETAALD